MSDNIQLTPEQAQKLGFKSVIEVGQDIGFTDFRKSSAYIVKDVFLDLENLGPLKKINPRLVLRKPIQDLGDENSVCKTWKSWRQVIEQEHYFTKYKIETSLVGQLSDIHFPIDTYPYKDNNFFKPYKDTKSVARLKEFNDFPYGRFRFPNYASNTTTLRINTINSGEQYLRPKFAGILSKEEKRKTYYRWYPSATKLANQADKFQNVNLSGFNIPYPNTLSTYNGNVFNAPVKITTKFNEGNELKGLIIISTGDAEQKTICYVSPHDVITGYINTVEDIYTETQTLKKSTSPGANVLATVQGASWTGSGQTGYLGCGEFGAFNNLNGTYRKASIPSLDNNRQRYYKLGEPQKQIYFDSTISTPYGIGAWCMALSGNLNININTGHQAVVYVHQPNSRTDWKKKDPRKLSGTWAVASGHPKAASSTDLEIAQINKPIISSWKTCRKNRSIQSVRLQVPSLIIDSQYVNGGNVLPEGIKYVPKTVISPIYSTWRASQITTGVGPNKGILLYPTGNQYSGYVISGQYVTAEQVIASGINIPNIAKTELAYGIDSTGHFRQQVPLKDTYFYKFYNQLYQNNDKTISTGTWDGIIPSGVRFSVELISTTLDSEVGINGANNLAVIYTGYGTEDYIDKTLIDAVSQDAAPVLFPNPSAKYIVSGEVPWHQKRNPYRHTFNSAGNLTYSAYKSGPTPNDSKNIARFFAIKKINSKILQLVNKVLPNLTYKNKKWKSSQKLKEKLKSFEGQKFGVISIPETANPSSVPQNRLRPHSQS